MKERFIELLSGKSLDTISDVEYVADFLIKNGATIPLCDIGTKVYAIYDVSKYEFNGKQRQRDCMVTSFGSKYRPARTTYGILHDINNLEIREVEYKKSYQSLIGKTVFLTKEEAKNALAHPTEKGGAE